MNGKVEFRTVGVVFAVLFEEGIGCTDITF